jgi:hypothetical protein
MYFTNVLGEIAVSIFRVVQEEQTTFQYLFLAIFPRHFVFSWKGFDSQIGQPEYLQL